MSLSNAADAATNGYGVTSNDFPLNVRNAIRRIGIGIAKEKSITAMARPTHGMSKTPEYKAWAGMISRCDPTAKRAKHTKHYADRGICVFPELRTFEGFYAVMGPKPPGKLISIDRIDVNDHYRAGNVRWANPRMQARNRNSSRFITYNGETLSVVEWSERLGVPYARLRGRLSRTGWSIDQAFTGRRYAHNGSRQLTAKNKLYGCDFALQTVSEWAAAFKISDSTIRRRLKNGWLIEKALYAPVNGTRHYPKKRKK